MSAKLVIFCAILSLPFDTIARFLPDSRSKSSNYRKNQRVNEKIRQVAVVGKAFFVALFQRFAG